MYYCGHVSYYVSSLQMWTLLRLCPNVITDGTFITLGSKCYYRWDLYYAWVQKLLQMGPLLRLGPFITLVPSIAQMAGCKTDFLCTLHLPHEQKFINLPGWCGKGRIKGPLLKGNQAKEFKPETIQEQVKWCTSTLQQRNYYTTWQIARVTKIHKFFTSIVITFTSTCSSSTSSLLRHFGYIIIITIDSCPWNSLANQDGKEKLKKTTTITGLKLNNKENRCTNTNILN